MAKNLPISKAPYRAKSKNVAGRLAPLPSTPRAVKKRAPKVCK